MMDMDMVLPRRRYALEVDGHLMVSRKPWERADSYGEVAATRAEPVSLVQPFGEGREGVAHTSLVYPDVRYVLVDDPVGEKGRRVASVCAHACFSNTCARSRSLWQTIVIIVGLRGYRMSVRERG